MMNYQLLIGWWMIYHLSIIRTFSNLITCYLYPPKWAFTFAFWAHLLYSYVVGNSWRNTSLTVMGSGGLFWAITNNSGSHSTINDQTTNLIESTPEWGTWPHLSIRHSGWRWQKNRGRILSWTINSIKIMINYQCRNYSHLSITFQSFISFRCLLFPTLVMDPETILIQQ